MSTDLAFLASLCTLHVALDVVYEILIAGSGLRLVPKWGWKAHLVSPVDAIGNCGGLKL